MCPPPETGELNAVARDQVQRIIANLPRHRVQHLQERADSEGQNLSEWIARLLEPTER
jgi:hypothetical protein